MTDKKLKRDLQIAGMRTFVNCFEAAARKGENLSDKDITAGDPRLVKIGALEGVPAKRNAIKRIMRGGKARQAKALKVCANAWVYEDTREKAAKMLKKLGK